MAKKKESQTKRKYNKNKKNTTQKRESVGSMQAYKSDLEKLKETRKKINQSKSTYFKPKPNKKYWMRILPAWKEKGVFFKEIFPVWYNTVDEGRGKVLCQNKNAYNFFIKQIADNHGLDPSEVAPKLRFRSSFAMNIVLLEYDESTNKRSYKNPTFMVWEAPKSVVEGLLDYYFEPEYGDFTDVNEGFDVQVHRDDSSDFTKYHVKLSRKDSQIPSNWLQEGLRNLDELYKPASKQDIIEAAKTVEIRE